MSKLTRGQVLDRANARDRILFEHETFPNDIEVDLNLTETTSVGSTRIDLMI